MIDSGSVVSVVPPTAEERRSPDHQSRHLHAANGTTIKTFGTRIDEFSIMGRRCRHSMIIADVQHPILGTDFFTEGQGRSFVIDVAHKCLRDRDTFCAAQAQFRATPVHSIMKPSWDIHHINNHCDEYARLLAQFPEITETDLEPFMEKKNCH